MPGREVEVLLSAAGDIVVRYDRELRHLFVNQAIEDVAGLPPSSFIGRTNRELGMPEELCELWERELGAVFERGVERRFEFAFEGPRGTRLLEANVVPERNAAGEVETILSVTRDRTESRRAEQEMRASEARYRELFERARDMIAVFDLDGRIAQVNPAVERTLGYSAAELAGREAASIFAHEDDEAAATRLAAVGGVDGTTESRGVFDTVMFAKDGHRIPVEASSELVLRDGVPYGTMVVAHDLSPRVAAQAALEESERRFRGAFDGVAVGMVIADPSTRVLQANTAFAEMLGYTQAELIGRSVHELVHEDDRDNFARDAERLRVGRGGRYFASDRRYRRKDGSIMIADVSVSAVTGDDGTTQFLAAQIEDVTELRHLQAKLEASHALYRAVVDVSPDVLSVVGLDGAVQLVSPSIEGILGYRVDEIVGRRYLEFVHPDDQLPAWSAIEAALRGESPPVVRSRVLARDGSIRLWDGTVRCSLDADGQPQAIVVNLRDVTNQVSLEEQFRQAQKMEAVGRLAGGVAHDFNNLLTAIGGYAELALGKLDGDGGAAELNGVIEASAKAASLTAQLLAFSRRQVLDPHTFDLGEVVGEMASLLQRLTPATIEVVTVLAPTPTPIHADRAQIEQVLMNLTVNAADAMPEGGRITVQVGVDGAALARLSVIDDGTGMDAVTAAQIFEPFFSTKGIEGTGLGLSIVHGIVSQSGGAISVDSEPGNGTTFTVTLPLTEIAANTPVPPVLVGHSAGETVLLVEDELVVREVVSQMLAQGGYHLSTAASGEEAAALAAAEPGTIDLLITDLILPGMNGRETASAVSVHQPLARVLYMSGYTDDVVIRAGGYDGGVAFIQKPFSSAELIARVRELLDTERAEATAT